MRPLCQALSRRPAVFCLPWHRGIRRHSPHTTRNSPSMLTLTLAMHVGGGGHGALGSQAHAALLLLVAFVLPVGQLGPLEPQDLLDLLQSEGLVDHTLEERGAGLHDCKGGAGCDLEQGVCQCTPPHNTQDRVARSMRRRSTPLPALALLPPGLG